MRKESAFCLHFCARSILVSSNAYTLRNDCWNSLFFTLKFRRNVGFFRYWTISQLPNWILSLPVLGLAALWMSSVYSQDTCILLKKTFLPWKFGNTVLLNNLLVHAHFTLITLLILVCNSHVQVVLRFASPGGLPAVWWGASHLFTMNSKEMDSKKRLWGKLLLSYLVLWNLTSTLLYSGFYPPA